MRKIFLFLLYLLMLFPVMSQVMLRQPLRNRTDLLLNADKVWLDGKQTTDPLQASITEKDKYSVPVIRNKKPKLYWQTDTSVKQISAYWLLVSTTPGFLDKRNGDVWDSKKITTSLSYAQYDGKPLIPGKIYFWKVLVWNEKDEPTPWSAVASFKMAESLATDTVSHYPLTADLQKPVNITQDGNKKYFIDFGKDALGQLQLHLSSSKDNVISVEVGEMAATENTIDVNPGRNIRFVRIDVPVREGLHDYTVTWPYDAKRNSRNPIQMDNAIGEVYPFRYVTIDNFAGRLDPESVQRKMVHYTFDDNASSFESSDDVLNQVWNLCKYSVKATSFTGFYVDGDRERLPYEADAMINQLSHFAVDAEYSMSRRTMAYLLYHPTWPTEWTLQNSILAWNDYMYTGDDSYLKKYYSELQKKLLISLAGPDGLISTATGKQTAEFLHSIHVKEFDGRKGLEDIVDWPQSGTVGAEKQYPGETDGFISTKYNAVVNAFYYHSLMLMQKIAAVVHKDEDARLYAAKAKQVLQSYQRVFMDPVNGLIKDGENTNHSSLHSNMFALDFGLVPDADISRVVTYIKSRKMACSVYGAQFLLDALYDNGEDAYALELLTATTQRSWFNMIRSGSTISMEAWDKVYKPNLDLNHAWGSAPANLVVRKLMGVEPLTPGFGTIQVKPRIGNLGSAKLKTTTIKGEVIVSFQKTKETDTWEVTIPGATTANVYLPAAAGKNSMLVDGKTTPVQWQKGFLVIEKLPAGKHQFVISN